MGTSTKTTEFHPPKLGAIYYKEDLVIFILSNEESPCSELIRNRRYESCYRIRIVSSKETKEIFCPKSALIYTLNHFNFTHL